MKTQSQVQMPAYQESGKEVTFFWNEAEVEREDETLYSYNYCTASIYDSRSTIIEKIVACAYPSYGAEVAAIVNGGDDAAAHAAMRVLAKSLADGWLNREA